MSNPRDRTVRGLLKDILKDMGFNTASQEAILGKAIDQKALHLVIARNLETEKKLDEISKQAKELSKSNDPNELSLAFLQFISKINNQIPRGTKGFGVYNRFRKMTGTNVININLNDPATLAAEIKNRTNERMQTQATTPPPAAPQRDWKQLFKDPKVIPLYLDAKHKNLHDEKDEKKLLADVTANLGIEAKGDILAQAYVVRAALVARRKEVNKAAEERDANKLYNSILFYIDNLKDPTAKLNTVLNKLEIAIADGTISIPVLLEKLEKENDFIREKMATLTERLGAEIAAENNAFVAKTHLELDKKENNYQYALNSVSTAWKRSLDMVKELSSATVQEQSKKADTIADALKSVLSHVPIPAVGGIAETIIDTAVERYKNKMGKVEFNEAKALKELEDDLSKALETEFKKKLIAEKQHFTEHFSNLKESKKQAKAMLYSQFQAGNNLDFSSINTAALLQKAGNSYKEKGAAALTKLAQFKLQQYDPSKEHADFFRHDAKGNIITRDEAKLAKLQDEMAKRAINTWLVKQGPKMKFSLDTWVKFAELRMVYPDDTIRKASPTLSKMSYVDFDREFAHLRKKMDASGAWSASNQEVKNKLHQQAKASFQQHSPTQHTQTTAYTAMKDAAYLPDDLHALRKTVLSEIQDQLEQPSASAEDKELAKLAGTLSQAFEQQDATLIAKSRQELETRIAQGQQRSAQLSTTSKMTQLMHGRADTLAIHLVAKLEKSTTAAPLEKLRVGLSELPIQQLNAYVLRKNKTSTKAEEINHLIDSIKKLQGKLEKNPGAKDAIQMIEIREEVRKLRNKYQDRTTLKDILKEIDEKINKTLVSAAQASDTQQPAPAPTATMTQRQDTTVKEPSSFTPKAGR